MTVTHTSGTGSLAQKVGAEFIVFAKEVVLHCDADYPGVVPISSIERIDGTLKVTWPKYDRINFKSYVLFRSYNDINGNSLATQISIPDKEQNVFVDDNYVGEYISYALAIQSLSTESIELGQGASYHDAGPEIVKYETLSGGKTRIHWTKSKYPQNFRSLQVYDDEGQIIKSTTELNDTTLVVDTGFGGHESFKIKTSSETGSCLSSTGYFWTDLPVVPFEKIAFSLANNTFYTRSFNYLYAYDMESNQKRDSVKFDIIPSYNGYFQVAVSPSGNSLWVYNDRTFYKLDPLTLGILDQIDVEPIVAGSGPYVTSLAISDNNLLAFQNYYSLVVYDLSARSVVAKRNTYPHDADDISISSDGQYVIASTNGAELFKLNGNELTPLARYTSAIFDYINLDKIVAYSWADKEFQIVDLSTQTVLEHYPYETFSGYHVIDPVTHWMFSFDDRKVVLSDIINGTELLNLNRSYYTSNILLYNGTVYTGVGAHVNFN